MVPRLKISALLNDWKLEGSNLVDQPISDLSPCQIVFNYGSRLNHLEK